MKLKNLPRVDMPREKLQKYGPEKLLDNELLAILLGSGIKGVNVLELSKKILKVIYKVGAKKLQREHLKGIKGLGISKTSQILAFLELGKRFNSETSAEILSTENIWRLCADFRDSKKEYFVAFYLNTQNFLIERQIISIGILNASLVHPREVFEPAIALHAASILVAHNHPSGSLEPSEQDVFITKRLIESGKLLGIDLVDHVIITKNRFKSVLDSEDT